MSWILPLPQLGGSDRTSIQSFLSGPGLVSSPVSVFKMIFNQIMNSGAGDVSTSCPKWNTLQRNCWSIPLGALGYDSVKVSKIESIWLSNVFGQVRIHPDGLLLGLPLSMAQTEKLIVSFVGPPYF